MKKRTVLKTILLISALIPFSSCKKNEPEKLLVIFNEMKEQYGDSILIKYKDFEILVDAGQKEDAKEVSKTLSTYVTDHVLDMVILTHPHADHIGGLSSSTLQNGGITSISTWIDSGANYNTSTYYSVENLKSSYISNGTTYYPAYDIINREDISTRFYLDQKDNVYIDIFNTGEYPEPNTYYQGGDINSVSVCFGLNHYSTQFFFGGDLTKNIESNLIKHESKDYYSKDKFVVYKASHHGSLGSNSFDILNWVKPDMFLTSSAITRDNRTIDGVKSSQHPYSGTINRFKAFTNQIYWNGTMGTFVCTSNGKTCNVSGSGRSINYYYNKSLVSSQEEKDLPLLDTKWYKEIK